MDSEENGIVIIITIVRLVAMTGMRIINEDFAMKDLTVIVVAANAVSQLKVDFNFSLH